MQTLLEEEATIMKQGGSIYARLPPAYFQYIGIEVNDNNIRHDIMIAMGLGKHGKFLYLYSPKQQKQFQKEQEKEENK